MELKDHSQITYEEAHLLSTGAYKNLKNTKEAPKQKWCIQFCFAARASLPHYTAYKHRLEIAV